MDAGPDRSTSYPVAAWLLAWLVLVPAIALDTFGLRTLADSPQLEASFQVVGNSVEVAHLQAGGVLQRAGIRRGDTLLSLAGRPVQPAAFVTEPEDFTSWRNQSLFWDWQRFLASATSRPSLQMVFARAIHPNLQTAAQSSIQTITVELPIHPLGWAQAWQRTLELRAVGWIFLLIFFLIWIKRQNECSLLFLVSGAGVFCSLTTEAIFNARDLCLAPAAFHLLGVVNYIATFSGIVVVHVGWIFPSPVAWLKRLPWLRALPWAISAVFLALHFGQRVFLPPQAFYLLLCLSLMGFMLTVLLRLRHADDPLLKPQLKWLLLAACGGFLPFALFSALPLSLSIPAVPVSFTLLFAVATPICILFSVFRYRLLDVDHIFDWVVVHAVVLGGLSFFEIVFWSWMDRRYAKDSASVPLLIAFSMFFLVSIYAPLRSWLFGYLTRISGRSRPTTIAAISKLLERAAETDPRRALEQTLQWTLKPARVSWLDPAQMQDELRERMKDEQDGLLGYELGRACPERMQSTAWVPIQTAQGLAVIVLWPQGGRGWTRDDLRLARALGHFGEPLLKIQSLQRDHARATAALREQRDDLLREMHDGLGGQLFAASLLTQIADDAPPNEMRQRLQDSNAAVAEALESLRTGLTILRSPPGAFGPALIALLMRSEHVLSAAGIRLKTDVADEATCLQMESQTLFSLLRALQEAITNVARHSKADNAAVRIALQNSILRIHIEDDGVGFDINQIARGFGLDDICSRMKNIDGRSTIASTPQQGSTLLLEIPLKTGIDERNSECFAD